MPLCCFRNLSGLDPDTAEEMVKQDVMTPLTGYFQVVAELFKITLFMKCPPMVFKRIRYRTHSLQCESYCLQKFYFDAVPHSGGGFGCWAVV
jgi:hypothetical protein